MSSKLLAAGKVVGSILPVWHLLCGLEPPAERAGDIVVLKPPEEALQPPHLIGHVHPMVDCSHLRHAQCTAGLMH